MLCLLPGICLSNFCFRSSLPEFVFCQILYRRAGAWALTVNQTFTEITFTVDWVLNITNEQTLYHGLDFSGYIQIPGFTFLSESNKNDVATHFECDFSHL